MYQERIYRNDVLNKMGHVFERLIFLLRSKSIQQDQIETTDYHLSEFMKVINESN